MRIYRAESVLEAARARIAWLFDEFPTVVASVSGGKDSTVVFHLCLEEARRRNRLPLDVLWIDQEAEWEATVDIVREWMYHPDVRPHWLQVPIRLHNATSATDHWLHCWDPARETDWVHPRDPIAFTENHYGIDRITKLFPAVIREDFPGRVANVGGVRGEESPGRLSGLTSVATYKWATWGQVLNRRRDQYTFYPLYDWSYSDVWKAIFDHGWRYNAIYDAQYRYGMQVQEMRVSNVHHETAVRSLWYMQEVEPETYNRLTRRILGVDAATKLGPLDYLIEKLPWMFSSWREYRDYLLEKLCDDERKRASFRRWFAAHARVFGTVDEDARYRSHIRAILLNDWEGVTLGNYLTGARARKRKELAQAQARVEELVV